MEIRKTIKTCGGSIVLAKHASSSTNTEMAFTVFFPSKASSEKVSCLMWLSGLTCTDDNFTSKAGAFKAAEAHGLAIIIPDTSPRGANIEGENDSWDHGSGAGFYVNATESKWIGENFKSVDTNNMSIFGHSMGGHGALVLALRNPSKYKSVSAFAPICNPINCPWGVKNFTGYLGANHEAWKSYDATELVLSAGKHTVDMLVDQGTADSFLEEQLKPAALEAACKSVGQHLTLRYQEGYDHSYFFITSFIDDHINFHAERLLRK